MDKTTTQYRRDLKQILVNHEDTVQELTKQIEDANVDYQRAVAERNAAFATSQAEEARTHQEKVDELMEQLNFLQRYNNKYNQEKLAQVEFALAKEKALYQAQTAAEKAELDLQNANEKAKHNAQQAQYQEELDEELALLNKHRGLLNSVRDEILLDEIENLTEQYNEQMASYNEQIAEAGKKGAAAAKAWSDAYSNYMQTTGMEKLKIAYTKTGYQTNRAFQSGWAQAPSGDKFTGVVISNSDLARNLAEAGWADGGYTGKGGENEIAGVVHKGEYVLPQNMVDQTTGTPKQMGNITINVNGTFATSAAERRKVADQIVTALQQNNMARLGA